MQFASKKLCVVVCIILGSHSANSHTLGIKAPLVFGENDAHETLILPLPTKLKEMTLSPLLLCASVEPRLIDSLIETCLLIREGSL